MKERKGSIGTLIILLGSLLLVPLVELLLNSLKSGNPLKKMNTINKNASVIFNLLLNAGFNERFASWITCQSAHETANFSSYIYRTNLNAFGMKYMGQKTARGEKNG